MKILFGRYPVQYLARCRQRAALTVCGWRQGTECLDARKLPEEIIAGWDKVWRAGCLPDRKSLKMSITPWG